MRSSLYGDGPSSGQLFGRGSKLLYAPRTDETIDTHKQPGRYTFIWDVAESSGYVLSDALQGYAPVSAKLHVTNLAIQAGSTTAQHVSGHACQSAKATVQLSDGSAVEFELLRATDLNGFPVQVAGATNVTFTLHLSKVRFEQAPAEAFSLPEGFTKYPSPEALADELAARQNNLRRRSPNQMMIPEVQQGSHY
jgi:hypothetical protein